MKVKGTASKKFIVTDNLVMAVNLDLNQMQFRLYDKEGTFFTGFHVDEDELKRALRLLQEHLEKLKKN
jgi:hypothetical protein